MRAVLNCQQVPISRGSDVQNIRPDVSEYIKADSSLKCNSQWWFGVTHLHPE